MDNIFFIELHFNVTYWIRVQYLSIIWIPARYFVYLDDAVGTRGRCVSKIFKRKPHEFDE